MLQWLESEGCILEIFLMCQQAKLLLAGSDSKYFETMQFSTPVTKPISTILMSSISQSWGATQIAPVTETSHFHTCYPFPFLPSPFSFHPSIRRPFFQSSFKPLKLLFSAFPHAYTLHSRTLSRVDLPATDRISWHINPWSSPLGFVAKSRTGSPVKNFCPTLHKNNKKCYNTLWMEKTATLFGS